MVFLQNIMKLKKKIPVAKDTGTKIKSMLYVIILVIL